MWSAATLTDPGGRSANEDSLGSLQIGEAWCWVVADGLGGHRGGKEASQLAVEQVLASFRHDSTPTAQALKAHVEDAHSAILARQQAEPELATMHSTVTVLVADEEHACWAHVGDTRLYHLRAGQVAFQTKDHSVPQVLADSGAITAAQIRHHEDRPRLLRSLGKSGQLKVAVLETACPVEPGDRFLLCTDGFWELITEAEMESDLAGSDSPQAWLDRMRARLLSRADGDHDNYTAVAVWGRSPG